jgi:myo-inositol-1(or 4)-monophosphatase
MMPGKPSDPLTNELSAARAAASAAAEVLLEGWGTRPATRFKASKADPVTEYDHRAEAIIVEHLTAAFPRDAIIGEEGSDRMGSSGRAWHIDPLDGTVNFTHGLPLFSVSIGLCEGDRPLLGVVNAPALGWTFAGALALGVTLNDRRVESSRVDALDRALLVTGFVPVPDDSNANIPEFAALMCASQGVRRLGSAALDLCFVACGWLDAYWERNIKSWDLVAGAAIVLAAGGAVCDPGGGPFVPTSGDILATNRHLQRPMLDILGRSRSG